MTDRLLFSLLMRRKPKEFFQVYVKDMEEKLGVFRLSQKIESMQEFINSRFKHKTMRIERERGFVFYSWDSEDEVPLKSLSSGEQHEIVLIYEMLFKVKKDFLVLIDEPEISLHVAWQLRFLEDFLVSLT